MTDKNLDTLRRLVACGAFMPDVAAQFPMNPRNALPKPTIAASVRPLPAQAVAATR